MRRVRAKGIISVMFPYAMYDAETGELVGYGYIPTEVSGDVNCRDLPREQWFTVEAVEVDESAW